MRVSFESFLNFLFTHNVLVIQVLFFSALTLTLALGLKAVLFPKTGSGDIGLGPMASGGLGKADITKIEELIKQAVEIKQSSPKGLSSGGTIEAEKALQAAQSEIKKLKASLAQKEQEIKSLTSSLAGATTSSTMGDTGASAELYEKIRNLEAKLAEYEIISEDIADLSKYKQENERLKKLIEELSNGKPPAKASSVEDQDNKTPAPALNSFSPSDVIDDDLMKEFAAAVEEQKSAKASPAQDEANQEALNLEGAANLEILASEAEGLNSEADAIASIESGLERDLDTDKLAAEASSMVSEEDKKLMEDFQQVMESKS